MLFLFSLVCSLQFVRMCCQCLFSIPFFFWKKMILCPFYSFGCMRKDAKSETPFTTWVLCHTYGGWWKRLNLPFCPSEANIIETRAVHVGSWRAFDTKKPFLSDTLYSNFGHASSELHGSSQTRLTLFFMPFYLSSSLFAWPSFSIGVSRWFIPLRERDIISPRFLVS